MRSISKPFSFSYPLKHKVVRDLKIVTEHVGDLLVEGTGYLDPAASRLNMFDRYNVDIDFVKWNNTDIKPVLTITGGLDEIIEAAVRHFASVAEEEVRVAA